MKFHCAYVAVFLTHSSIDQQLGWFHFFCMKSTEKNYILKKICLTLRKKSFKMNQDPNVKLEM